MSLEEDWYPSEEDEERSEQAQEMDQEGFFSPGVESAPGSSSPAPSPPSSSGGMSRSLHVKPLNGNASEDVCAICLGPFETLTLLENCLHRFCFVCILQWASITPKCPLCKKPIRNLLYDITSDYQYRKFDIDQLKKSSSAKPGEKKVDKFPSDVHRRRKTIYTKKLKASVPTSAKAFTPLTPENITLGKWDNKLRAWIERELQAILQEEDVSLVLHIVKSLVFACDIKSPEAKEKLQGLLHEDTDSFIHELSLFAASPWDLPTYDRLVSYEPPTPLAKPLPNSSSASALSSSSPHRSLEGKSTPSSSTTSTSAASASKSLSAPTSTPSNASNPSLFIFPADPFLVPQTSNPQEFKIIEEISQIDVQIQEKKRKLEKIAKDIEESTMKVKEITPVSKKSS